MRIVPFDHLASENSPQGGWEDLADARGILTVDLLVGQCGVFELNFDNGNRTLLEVEEQAIGLAEPLTVVIVGVCDPRGRYIVIPIKLSKVSLRVAFVQDAGLLRPGVPLNSSIT